MYYDCAAVGPGAVLSTTVWLGSVGQCGRAFRDERLIEFTIQLG